jgi:hypothetical protein
MGATTTAPWSPVYPPALATPITSETLAAVRALTAWVLKRERAAQAGSAPPPAPQALRQQLEALPSATLLQGIKRHRLEPLLQADPGVDDLLPDLRADLQRAARREAMAALALASLTREMAVLFAEASIPLLVIKGIPLALQTTGSLTARGRGDCDLFVDPAQVGAAIALLQSAGFALSYGTSCVGDASLRGRYSRFVSIEVSLQRDVGGQRQWIDLHWHATHARGVLPGFQVLWQRGEELQINGQPIRTLSHRDAFVHACCHATNDRWMALRNLVDLERLGRALSSAQRVDLNRLRAVRKCWLALADAFEQTSASWRFGRAQAVRLKAEVAQQRPWRSLGDGEWTVTNRLRYLAHKVNLSHHPVHGCSMLLQQLMPPGDLVDPQTGDVRSLWQVVLWRAGKLRRRLQAQAESPDRPA